MRSALLALILACSGAPSVVAPVAEAFDVPPPPGQRALDLGPIDSLPDHLQPGAPLLVEGQRLELLDRRDLEGRGYLTVYADEADAERWLESGAATVSWSR